MEIETVVAEGNGWLMILNKDGELCTIKRSHKDTFKKTIIDRFKGTARPLLMWFSDQNKRLGLIGLVVFGSMATGCMTEHVLSHYQLGRMVDHAIHSNPEMEDFNDE